MVEFDYSGLDVVEVPQGAAADLRAMREAGYGPDYPEPVDWSGLELVDEDAPSSTSVDWDAEKDWARQFNPVLRDDGSPFPTKSHASIAKRKLGMEDAKVLPLPEGGFHLARAPATDEDRARLDRVNARIGREDAPEDETTTLGEIGEIPAGVAAGMVGTAGTALQGVSAGFSPARDDIPEERKAVLRTKMREAEAALMAGDAEKYSRLTREIHQEALVPVTQRAGFQAGQRIRDWGERTFPATEGYEDSFGRQVGEGVGSLLTGVAASAVHPGAAMVLFTTLGMGEAADRAATALSEKHGSEAVDKGEYDEQITRAAILGVGPGMTDQVPVEILLKRLPVPGAKAVGQAIRSFGGEKVMRAIGRIGSQAAIEAVQEGGQQALQNLIARHVHSPETEITEGVLPGAGVGGVVGGIAGVGREAVLNLAGRRSRSSRGARAKAAEEVPPPSPEDEASPIPTETIVEGRKVVADAEGRKVANRILETEGMPPVGTPVRIGIGRKAYEGVVTDAWGEGPEAGITVTEGDGTVIDSTLRELLEFGAEVEVLSDAYVEGQPEPTEDAMVDRTVETIDPEIAAQDRHLAELKSVADASEFAVEAHELAGKDIPLAEREARVSNALGLFGYDSTADVPTTVRPAVLEAVRDQTRIEDAERRAAALADLPEGDVETTAPVETAVAPQNREFPVLAPATPATAPDIAEIAPETPVALPEGDVETTAPVETEDVPRPAAVAPAAAEDTGGAPEVRPPPAPPTPSPEALPELDVDDLAPVETEVPPSPMRAEVDAAEAETNTEPTEGQKEAGNYAKGRVRIRPGIEIVVENPKGSERSGRDKDGNEWSVTMPATYGYLSRTEGADGDQVDVYVGPEPESDEVFLVDQVDADTRAFDEHKVMLGYATEDEAIADYDAAFDDGRGPERRGAVTPMDMEDFRSWLANGDTRNPVGNIPIEPEALPAGVDVSPSPAPVERAGGEAETAEAPPPQPEDPNEPEGLTAMQRVARRRAAARAATMEPAEAREYLDNLALAGYRVEGIEIPGESARPQPSPEAMVDRTVETEADVTAEPEIRVKLNGEPFGSERTAALAADRREMLNAGEFEIVPVEGGFGIRIADEALVDRTVETEAPVTASEQEPRRPSETARGDVGISGQEQDRDRGPRPEMVFRKDGQPFKSARAAEFARRAKKIEGDVVEVEGGFAVEAARGEQDGEGPVPPAREETREVPPDVEDVGDAQEIAAPEIPEQADAVPPAGVGRTDGGVAPEIVVRRNGEPFGGIGSARAAARRDGVENFRVVRVEGGYGYEATAEDPAVTRAREDAREAQDEPLPGALARDDLPPGWAMHRTSAGQYVADSAGRRTRPFATPEEAAEAARETAAARDALDAARADAAARGLTGQEAARDVAARMEARSRAEASAPYQIPGSVPSRPVREVDRPSRVITPAGRRVEVQPIVVEARDLIASHDETGRENPTFPSEFQPRDRSRAASQEQIASMAGELIPELLMPSAQSAEGAPVVGPDRVVESGNARTLAVRRAYEMGLADDYRNHLVERGYEIEGFEQPVLVQQRLTSMTPEERAEFAREANARTTADRGASEVAQADAAGVTREMLELYAPGDIGSAGNREFVRSFVSGVVPDMERAGMMAADGTLSQAGKQRIENALFDKAYDDAELLGSLREDLDTNVKSLGGALLDAAPEWARMRLAVAEGSADPMVDHTEHIIAAVRMVRKARAEGTRLRELVAQDEMFAGDVMHPLAEDWLRSMYADGQNLTRPYGRPRLAEGLTFWADEAQKKQAGTNMFGETVDEAEIAAMMDLTRRKIARIEEARQADAETQADLLGGVAAESAGTYQEGPGAAGAEPARRGRADAGRERGDQEGRERAERGLREPGVADGFSPRQLALFADRGPGAVPDRPAGEDAPQAPRRQVRGIAKTDVLALEDVRVGLERVRSPEDAAHIAAPFRKEPQETLIGIVLGEGDRLIGTIRHSVGTASSVPLDTPLFLGAIAQIPEARAFYIAHQHPSGTLSLSAADKAVNRNIADLTRNTGLDYRGSVVVAPGGRKGVFDAPDSDLGHGRSIDVTPAPRRQAAPVYRRRWTQIPPQSPRVRISSSTALEAAAREHLPELSGIMFLDNSLNLVGTMALDTAEMSRLRGPGGAARDIYEAFAETNASRSAILARQGEGGRGPAMDALENMRRFARALSRVGGNGNEVDAILYDANGKVVLHDREELSPGKSFLQRDAAPEPILKKNGGPFGTRKSAAAAAKSRGLDAEPVEIEGGWALQTAWHGSPHRFDEFRTEAIGTGEGAQAYGHGLYFADRQEVADWYRGKLSGVEMSFGGRALSDAAPALIGELDKQGHSAGATVAVSTLNRVAKASTSSDQKIIAAALMSEAQAASMQAESAALAYLAGMVNDGRIEVKSPGATYRVNLAPAEDEYLLWDVPTRDQPPKVKAALTALGIDVDGVYRNEQGKHAYNQVAYEETGDADNQRAASAALLRAGIRGIKYRDAMSRGKDEGSYNYVIFDDADVSIEEILAQRAQASAADPSDRVRIRPTRRFDAERLRIRAEIEATGERAFGKGFNIRLADEIVTPEGDRATGAFDPAARIAYIALRDPEEMTGTLHHEGLHYLRRAGAFTKQDGNPTKSWQVLEAEASRWREKYRIDERYPEGIGEDLLNEEAIAEAIDDYAKNKPADVTGKVKLAMDRILAFWKRLGNAIRGRGFQTATDVFEGIQAGEFVGPDGQTDTQTMERYLQTAWHGSPHEFDRFSTEAIGTGEGAQEYGFGLYFAEKKGVAEHYRKVLARPDVEVRGEKVDAEANEVLHGAMANVLELMDPVGNRWPHTFDEARERQISQLEQTTESAMRGDWSNKDQVEAENTEVIEALRGLNEGDLRYGEAGATYRVDLAPKESEYLHWDRQLAAQSKDVRGALREMGRAAKEYQTGEDIYREAANELGSDRAASEALLAAGIRGIKYLDQSSRPMGGAMGMARMGLKKPSYNYVIFDDSDVAIEEIMLQRERLGEFETEPGAEGFDQAIIPGTEPLTERQLAERRMQGRMTTDREQRPMDEGLFGEAEGEQGTLFQRIPAENREAFEEAATQQFGVDMKGAAEVAKQDKSVFAKWGEELGDQLLGPTRKGKAEGIQVLDIEDPRDLNAALRWLAPPGVGFAKKSPELHKVWRQGVKAEIDQSVYIGRLNREWDGITRPLDKAEFEQLTGLMFLGDAEARAFTDAELDDFKVPDKVKTAYKGARRFLDKLGRWTEQHERNMKVDLLRRRSALIRDLAGRRGMAIEAFRELYKERSILKGHMRHGRGNPNQLAAEIQDADERLHGEMLEDPEYRELAGEADSIEARLENTTVRRRSGYVPHKFFGDWAISAADPEGKTFIPVAETGPEVQGPLAPVWSQVAGEHGHFPSRMAALKAAKEYKKAYPNKLVIVKPVEFQFPDSKATVLTDAAYRSLRERVSRLMEVTGEDLDAVLDGVARPRNRRRFAGFEQYREGMPGFNKNLDRVIRAHIGETVRYTTLDRLKYDAITAMEKEGLQRSRVTQERPELQKAVEAFLRDVNGQKQPLETQVDSILNRPWATPLRVGLATAGTVGAAVGAVQSSAFAGALIGSYVGFRVTKSLAQGGQFPSRAVTAGMLSDMSHLKLGMLFNMSSAMVNLSQTALTTYPVLGGKHTMAGMRRFQAAMLSNMRGKPNADWKALLKHDINPTFGFTEGTKNQFQKESNVSKLSMLPFTAAESFNRAVAFLGGMNKAEAQGQDWAKAVEQGRRAMHQVRQREEAFHPTMPGPAMRHGTRVIERTQFHYGSASKPELLRGNFLRVPLQFKNFMAQMLTFTFGLRGKEIPRFVLALGLTAGALGMVGIELLDWILQGLTGGWSLIDGIKEGALKMAAEGDLEGGVGQLVARGVPGLVGVDLSTRTGLGDKFLPAEARDLYGPWYSTVKNAARHAAEGASVIEQVRNLSPGLGNPLRAIEAAGAGGQVSNAWKRGRPEMTYTPGELTLKATGFRPVRESMEQDWRDIMKRRADRARLGSRRYIDRAVRAIQNGQRRRLTEIMREAADAGTPITPGQLRGALKGMMTERAQRTIRTLPRSLQGEARDLRRGLDRAAPR